jgi:hypothetical protein
MKRGGKGGGGGGEENYKTYSGGVSTVATHIRIFRTPQAH